MPSGSPPSNTRFAAIARLAWVKKGLGGMERLGTLERPWRHHSRGPLDETNTWARTSKRVVGARCGWSPTQGPWLEPDAGMAARRHGGLQS
eukprot:scaffold130188_cov28-Tisochrysis_lutea.AAC.9